MSRYDHRSAKIEVMDDLFCEGEVVHQTLRELEIINRWLGGNEVTMNGLRQLLGNLSKNQPLAIADLGCGGGGMLRLIDKWGRIEHHSLHLVGIDANSHIVAFARAHSIQHPSIQFEDINIFSWDFRKRKYDICLATLFTHHFTDEQLVDLFRWFGSNVAIGAVVNDIHRHWFAFHSIRLLTRFFSKSKMVRYDAPLSVLRAFKKKELESILKNAGINQYTLKWKWAFRWQLIIYGKDRLNAV